MSETPEVQKGPPRTAWIALFAFLILMQYIGGVGALVSALTLGFGFNNNGTIITDVGNLSINVTAVQSAITGMNTSISLICDVNLIALTSKTQNFTYQNGILLTNTSCV